MTESLLFAIDGRNDLAQKILDESKLLNLELNTELGHSHNQQFSDGELCIDFTDSVRGKKVYILTSPHNSDEIIRLTLAIDAGRRAGAREIIPILPYFPYARQDKKDQSRGPIGAKVMSEVIQHCGATSIITFEMHTEQIAGFFSIPLIHIEGKNVFDKYIKSIYTDNTVLAGPDAGSGKRVKRMKDQLAKYHNIQLNYIMLDKTRKQANIVDEMVIIGDVNGKDVIIIDDMIDTFGTANKAVEVLLENGAKSVKMIASHGVLSGPAYERILSSKVTELIISDSLETQPNEKIKIISVSEQIAMVMAALNNNMSYEAMKENKKQV